MNKELHQDERGLTHIMLAALAVLVLGAISVIGWGVISSHNTNNVASVTAKRASIKAQAITTTSATGSGVSPSTSPAVKSTNPPAPTSKTSTQKPVAAPPSSTPSPTQSPNVVVPSGYSRLGTIAASNLYNVKVPPPTSQQPDMTIYACIRNTGTNTAYVQTLGVLSYPIPQSSSSAWYIGLDLSSSATTDNRISTKTTDYGYQNNSWQNNGGPGGTVNQSTPITTATINPGVVTDYYVWASGSYGGTTWQPVNNHPNVTQLAACN